MHRYRPQSSWGHRSYLGVPGVPGGVSRLLGVEGLGCDGFRRTGLSVFDARFRAQDFAAKLVFSGPSPFRLALDMLRIRTVSGDELLSLDLASLHAMLPADTYPVRALKQHLHKLCGLSRFRQRRYIWLTMRFQMTIAP